MRLGKNKCDWCSCMAECAVGGRWVGSSTTASHKGTQRKWVAGRGHVQTVKIVKVCFLQQSLSWNFLNLGRELQGTITYPTWRKPEHMENHGLKKVPAEGMGDMFSFFQQEDICCTIFLEILGLHPRPSSFIGHLIMWHTQHWTLCNGPKTAKYTVCFSNPSYITLTYNINCILTYQRCWFKKGNLGICIPKNLHDIILQTC